MEFFVLLLLGVFILLFFLGGITDYFSPWMITCEIWLVMLIMLQMQGELLYPLGPQFIYCLIIWLPIFCLSSIISFYVFRQKGTDLFPSTNKEMSVNIPLFNFFFVITILITPLQLYNVLKIVMMFDTQNLLSNIRTLAVYGDNNYGFLNYAHVLNQVLFIIALWHYPHISKWKLIILVFSNLISCFSMMEKSGIFFLILSSIFVLFKKNVITAKGIVTAIGCMVAIFFFINYSLAQSSGTKEMDFMEFFACYVTSPPVAFERIQPELEGQFGSHTFQYFYLFLDRWGLGHFVVNQRIQDFVFVPVSTNVYTIFQPFFEDFEYKGIAFFAFVYGVLSGIAYRFYINGSSMGKCIYALVVEILVLQFYSESFIQNLVLSLQFIFFVVLITQDKYDISFRKKNLVPAITEK